MLTTPRFDMYTPIHKALRRVMFETAIALARTDFNDADEVAAATRSVSDCATFMREHAEHEDRELVPLIARLDPELGAALEREHPELERLTIDTESLWPRLEALDVPVGRAQMGAELARRFQTLVAAQLRHMDREEREVNAVLWANLGDDELRQINLRIVKAIEPARLQELMPLIAASLSRPEREAMAAPRAA
jgi:hemerythrin-like domain-containing protein